MKFARLVLLWVVCTAAAGAHPHHEPQIKQSLPERSAITASKTLTLSEGLPHPSDEPKIFSKQAKRRDTRDLADFKFYTPELQPDAERSQRLRKILTGSASYAVWTQKRCGGFHPDWAVHWRDARNGEIHALICFGCNEIMILSPHQQLRYHLTPAAAAKLQAELGPMRSKRPGKTNP